MASRDLAIPRFQQVRLALRDRIRSGYYDSGMPLPGERQLAQEFAVARVTIRSALARLKEEGLVIRLPGKGTVPKPDSATASRAAHANALLDNIVSMGLRTRVTVLDWRLVNATSDAARALGVAAGEPVLKVIRVRKFRTHPISYTEVFLPADLASVIDRHTLQDTPMLVAMERNGVNVVSAEQTLGAAAADAGVARILGIAPGVPLLKVSRIARDDTGRAVQYLTGLYHPDRYEYRMRLSRIGGDTNVWIDADRQQGSEGQEAGE